MLQNNVKFLNKPFVYKSTDLYNREIVVETKQTVEVTIINYGEKYTCKYGYVSPEEIYRAIKEEKRLTLTKCYVKDVDFSFLALKSFEAERALFDGKIDFHNTEFTDANFYRTHFYGNINFRKVQFHERTIFEHAEFCGDVSFDGATFHSEANFNQTVYPNEFTFWHTTFFDIASFNDLRGGADIIFDTVKFYSFFVLSFFSCVGLSLDHCFIEKSCVISFDGGIQYFYLDTCQCFGSFSIPFSDDLKRAIYRAERRRENHLHQMKVIENRNTKTPKNQSVPQTVEKRNDDIEVPQKWRTPEDLLSLTELYSLIRWHKYNNITQTFNFLRINYNRNGENEYEDLAYVEYRRCKRKMKKPLIQFLDWFFLDVISQYSTKPFRVFLWAVVTIFIFAGIYCVPDTLNTKALMYHGFWASLYHSIITFFTIGFGDSKPINALGLILTGLEGFIGVFLMSLFTVSFVRKVLR